jgi:hypothetical protein
MDRIISKPKINEENLQNKAVHKTVEEEFGMNRDWLWTYRF